MLEYKHKPPCLALKRLVRNTSSSSINPQKSTYLYQLSSNKKKWSFLQQAPKQGEQLQLHLGYTSEGTEGTTGYTHSEAPLTCEDVGISNAPLLRRHSTASKPHGEKCKKCSCSQVTRDSNIRMLSIKDRRWSSRSHLQIRLAVLWTGEGQHLNTGMQALTTCSTPRSNSG